MVNRKVFLNKQTCKTARDSNSRKLIDTVLNAKNILVNFTLVIAIKTSSPCKIMNLFSDIAIALAYPGLIMSEMQKQNAASCLGYNNSNKSSDLLKNSGEVLFTRINQSYLPSYLCHNLLYFVAARVRHDITF